MDAVYDFAPSTDAAPRKSAATDRIETWLEVQRDQLPLWLPVPNGSGAGWLGGDDRSLWPPSSAN
jgi:competence protein ComEC